MKTRKKAVLLCTFCVAAMLLNGLRDGKDILVGEWEFMKHYTALDPPDPFALTPAIASYGYEERPRIVHVFFRNFTGKILLYLNIEEYETPYARHFVWSRYDGSLTTRFTDERYGFTRNYLYTHPYLNLYTRSHTVRVIEHVATHTTVLRRITN